LSLGEAQVQRNRTGLNVNNKKHSLLRQKVPISNKVQKGSEQAGQEYIGDKEDRTKDNNTAGDKGKTGTIYRGGTGVRHKTVTRREWLRAGEGN